MTGTPILSVRARDGFALTGPSVILDPATHAVRPDLADIRLAGQVFASHYAAAIPFRAIRAATVMAAKQEGVAATRLKPGDLFDVLELSHDCAWGIATTAGLVGYVDRDAIEPLA